MIKQCARCGKEFDSYHGAKYCSDDCRLEVRREHCRRWQKNNPEKARECNRRWRAANPEKAYALVKRYRQRHPDVRYAQNKRWRKRHPDKARAILYRWREKNREHYNAYNRRYRAEKKRLKWIAERAAHLRAVLKAKAAERKAKQPKRERHWVEDVAFPLVSSCQSTYIY